ncbi:hypothetical protein RSK20926_11874 [Roseobacter sp. SK209-2-6]|nr:hypothetical protein RSK20926_11874 [Roseobacter sp. SK209-2-6]
MDEPKEIKMPIAIIISHEDIAPAILQEDKAADLLKAINALTVTPDLGNEDSARLWLQEQPAPSGWFNTLEEAQAHVRRCHNPVPILPGKVIQRTREAMGMTRAEFARALGIGKTDKNRHTEIFNIEIEKINKSSGRPRVLNPKATERLMALAAEHGLNLLKDD